MKFSVICPVKNESKIISRMIDSVISQKEDFEITCVGISEDGTKEIIQSYANDDIRFIESYNPIHQAVEEGRLASSGDVIVNLGADDYFANGCFKKVIEAFEKNTKGVLAGLAKQSDGVILSNENHKTVGTPACFFKTDFLKKHNLNYEYEKYPWLADYVLRAKSWFIEEPILFSEILVYLEISQESPIHSNKEARYAEYRKFLQEVVK